MTCAAWVETLIIRNDGGRKTYRSCKKYLFLLLHDHLTGCHLSVFVSKKREATWNTTQNKCIISRVQNTTVLQPNLILTGYIAYKQGRSVLPSTNHYQIQLQACQPLSINAYKTDREVRWRLKSNSLGDIKDLNRWLIFGSSFCDVSVLPYKTRTNHLCHIINNMVNECT